MIAMHLVTSSLTAFLQGFVEEDDRLLIAVELASGSLQSWCSQFEHRRLPLAQWVRMPSH